MHKSKILPVVVGAGTLAMSQLNTAEAQTTSRMDSSTPVIEQATDGVVKTFQLTPEDVKLDSTALPSDAIGFFDAKEKFELEQGKAEGGKPGIEPDPGEGGENEKGGPGIESNPGEGGGNQEGDAGDSQSEELENSQVKDSPITVSGSVGFGNEFLEGSGSVLSPNLSYSLACQVAHKSGLGISSFRLSDLDKTNPGSRLTQLSASYKQQIGLPKDWNIFLSGNVSYINFDNFMADNDENGEKVKLNEFSGFLQIVFQGKILSFELSTLYNAYCNNITPNSVVNKAAVGVKIGKNTKVTGEGRWQINEKNEQAFRAALKIDHKFTDNFSGYLGAVTSLGDGNIKPTMVIGVNASGVLFGGKNR